MTRPCERLGMKDVSLHLACDPGVSKEVLLRTFTQEVDDFSAWLEKAPPALQQGALTKPERILLLTYLMQKYAGNLDR